MFVLHCGTGRKNPVYRASTFYSMSIISQLEEKVSESTGHFVSTCRAGGRGKNSPTTNESVFSCFFVTKKDAARRRRAPPGTSFSLDYPTSRASPSRPSLFSFITGATKICSTPPSPSLSPAAIIWCYPCSTLCSAPW